MYSGSVLEEEPFVCYMHFITNQSWYSDHTVTWDQSDQ